jgi:hypothetical protein
LQTRNGSNPFNLSVKRPISGSSSKASVETATKRKSTKCKSAQTTLQSLKFRDCEGLPRGKKRGKKKKKKGKKKEEKKKKKKKN